MQKIEIATFIRWYNSMGAKHKNADISCYEFLFLLLSFNQSDHINALYRHKNIKTWPKLKKNRLCSHKSALWRSINGLILAKKVKIVNY